MDKTALFETLDKWYSEHRIENVPYWIKQSYLYKKLDEFPKDLFSQEVVGESTEQRPIRLLTLGNGPTPVLMWTQMHGDEPTATRALLDMFALIQQHKESDIIQPIVQNLTLYILPILNPDGAERFTRRTALGIDMNRDALAFKTPEGRILKSVRDKYNTGWAYSLHDQLPRYTAGGTGNAAGISLLSAASDWDVTLTDIRRDTMRLASSVAEYVQYIIPGQIGRYDDAYEPRAFGDRLHLWGTRNVLIESGYIPRDRYKETIRRANAIAVLGSLYHLAKDDLPSDELYHSLPVNRRYFAEYIFKNPAVSINGVHTGSQDVAFHLEQIADNNASTVSFKLILTDLGDCSPYTGSYIFEGPKLQIRFSTDPGSVSQLPVMEEYANCEIIDDETGKRLVIKEGIPDGNPEVTFRNLLK